MEVQLTDAQLAQFTACGLIVVDGEPCPESEIMERAGGGSVVYCPHRNDGIQHYAAPELWRKLTEPCATCVGEGFESWPGVGHARVIGGDCPNPDCDRGRQVVTLKATCPTYAWTPKGFDDEWRCQACDKCGGSGVVTLGRFTIRLLPVRDPYHPMPAGAPWLVVNRDGHCYLIDADGAARGANLPLDPLPQPGQFAVQFETAT